MSPGEGEVGWRKSWSGVYAVERDDDAWAGWRESGNGRNGAYGGRGRSGWRWSRVGGAYFGRCGSVCARPWPLARLTNLVKSNGGTVNSGKILSSLLDC